MKTSLSIKLLALIAIASPLSLGVGSASAVDLTYNGATAYKDADGNYYKVTSNPVKVTYTGATINKSIYSDACGFVKLSFSQANGSIPNNILFGGTSDVISSIAKGYASTSTPMYSCKNGVAGGGNTSLTTVFKSTSNTGDPDYFDTLTLYYPPNRTGGANKLNIVNYTADNIASLKPNACGFVRFLPKDDVQRRTTSNFKIDGAAVNMATLPVNPNPPSCTGGKLYTIGSIPSNFPPISVANKTVFVTGLTPNSLNVINYDVWESQSVRTNSCGLANIRYRLAATPDKIRVGSNVYSNLTSMTQTSPWLTCTSANFATTPVGTLVKVGINDYVIKTADVDKTYLFEKSLIATRNVPVNACGFATIASPNKLNGYTATDKLVINGSSPYTVTSLPATPSSVSCRNGIVYTSPNN